MRASWLALALLGCPKKGPDNAADETRYALLRPDTPLRISPAAAPQTPWRSLDVAAADAARGYGWTLWRVVRSDETWTELESVPATDPDAFCAAAFAPLEGLALNLWVATSALGTVTTTEVTQVYVDGTGWQLSAGLPVVVSANGSSVVRIGGGLSLLLPQPPASVATTFVASPLLPPVTGPPATVPADHLVPLGPDAALGFDAVHEPLIIEEPPNLDGLAVAATRCAKIVAPIVAAGDLGVDRFAGSKHPEIPLAVAAGGATVYWPIGTVAGHVISDRPLDIEVESSKGRRCFAIDLVKWRPDGEEPVPDQILTICLDPSDVLQEDV
jgi:hypothetical protein